MAVFKHKDGPAAQTIANKQLHPHIKRHQPLHLRQAWWIFCSALLIESVAMQLLTQINQIVGSDGSEVVATGVSQQKAATGKVALMAVTTPTPVTSTPTPRPGLVKPVLAATPAQPLTDPHLIFHKPLRSYVITQYFSAYHPAIDMAAPTGTPIYSTTEGTVSGTGYLIEGGGLMVKVTHPNGYVSYYAHLSVITSTVGQQVDNSVQIGKVGATGWATGPHLHFMILKDGKNINPLSVLQ